MNDELELKGKEQAIVAPPKIDLPESIDDFDMEDLTLSNLFICQDQSNKARDKGIEPGTLYDSISDESYESLELIMVYHYKTRILYGENIGDQLICYSKDNKVSSHPTPISPNCATCPQNIRPAEEIQPGESKYGKCNKTFNFACILSGIEVGSEKDFPFMLSMQRTNARTAKIILNTTIRKRQELYSISKVIGVEQVVKDNYRWYSFVVGEGKPILEVDEERARYWLQFIKLMKNADKLVVDIEGEESEKDITPKEDVPF